MGVEIKNPSGVTKYLNFRLIKQEWLKTYAKKFIKYEASRGLSHAALSKHFAAFRKFSVFLHQYAPIDCIEEVDREVCLAFSSYLRTRNYKPSYLKIILHSLKSFLETSYLNSWYDVEPYILCFDDIPNVPESLPRFIPDFVLNQLNSNIHKLPSPVMRMVLVIQECALRISELTTLTIDCLERDNHGRFWLNFVRAKTKQETRLPISNDIADVIKEQQSFIVEILGREWKFLFCGSSSVNEFMPKPNLMSTQTFSRYLKKLAKDCDIRDENGELWNFTSHQFRHTKATSMINDGVRQIVVQRYLGHKSPQMTAVYAHIHDETLRKELELFLQNKTIDISGTAIGFDWKDDSDDLTWFTEEICGIGLANGYCARPKKEGDCDIPGDVGCYLCPHFRTHKGFIAEHKKHLVNIESILDKAYSHGWVKSIKKNEALRDNLRLIISSLEKKTDNE